MSAHAIFEHGAGGAHVSRFTCHGYHEMENVFSLLETFHVQPVHLYSLGWCWNMLFGFFLRRCGDGNLLKVKLLVLAFPLSL